MDPKIEAVLNSELSEEDAAKVKAALQDLAVDPGVGAVLRNPSTGDVALRVGQYAETYWRIYATDDRTWIEKEPLVGWDVLFDAPAVVTTPGDAAVDPVTDDAPVEAEVAEVAPAKTTTKK
jgi:hypothetical protein